MQINPKNEAQLEEMLNNLIAHGLYVADIPILNLLQDRGESSWPFIQTNPFLDLETSAKAYCCVAWRNREVETSLKVINLEEPDGR